MSCLFIGCECSGSFLCFSSPHSCFVLTHTHTHTHTFTHWFEFCGAPVDAEQFLIITVRKRTDDRHFLWITDRKEKEKQKRRSRRQRYWEGFLFPFPSLFCFLNLFQHMCLCVCICGLCVCVNVRMCDPILWQKDFRNTVSHKLLSRSTQLHWLTSPTYATISLCHIKTQ